VRVASQAGLRVFTFSLRGAERQDARVAVAMRPSAKGAKGAARISAPAGKHHGAAAVRRGGIAKFAPACADYPLADQCTTAKEGRTIYAGPTSSNSVRPPAPIHLAWKADYKATRAEGRVQALALDAPPPRRPPRRVRSKPTVAADFALLADTVNLARLAVLGTIAQRAGLTGQLRQTRPLAVGRSEPHTGW
jgi:hypothetical protein